MVMTQRGKTLLKGHTLYGEGHGAFNDEGKFLGVLAYGVSRGGCTCGEAAPKGWSCKRVKKWHRAHKDALRGES